MPKPITPLLAADVIIELIDFPDRPIVLIERANPPYGWAIPGGFVDLGEIVGYQLKAGQIEVKPFVVSLSNHERLNRSPFDRLRANG